MGNENGPSKVTGTAIGLFGRNELHKANLNRTQARTSTGHIMCPGGRFEYLFEYFRN